MNSRSSSRSKQRASVDLSALKPHRTKSATKREDPWEAMDRFITDHSHATRRGRWGTTSMIDVSYGKSRTVLEVTVRRMFTGDIKSVDMTLDHDGSPCR